MPRIACLERNAGAHAPSKDHERLKSYIGRFIEAYVLGRGINPSPYGGWTPKNAPKQSGLGTGRVLPRPAAESTGSRSTAASVSEVWIWRDSPVVVHVLRQQRYQLEAKSALFSNLDVQLLASFLHRPTALRRQGISRSTSRLRNVVKRTISIRSPRESRVAALEAE